MKLICDVTLLHEAEQIRTGAIAHDLNALLGRYKAAEQDAHEKDFLIWENQLRSWINKIKDQKRNASTCNHVKEKLYSLKFNNKDYSFTYCSNCGRSVEVK